MLTGVPARAAVIGGGLMGHGIAQVLACAGAQVRVWEPVEAVRATVHARIATNLAELGLPDDAVGRVVLATSLADAVGDAGYVTEAAVEDVALKQRIFRELAEAAPADAILATNTSVIRVGDVAEGNPAAERIVGTHWWNPPFLIPLVEVVQGAATSLAVVEATIAVLAACGKEAVHVRKDAPGFVGNRMQHALWREAMAIVEAGICDAETVDRAVRASFGLRLPVLGPLENADLVGLDLTLAIHDYLLPHLDATPGAVPVLRRHVEAGELGAKTGSGFLAWPPGAQEATRRRLVDHLIAARDGEAV